MAWACCSDALAAAAHRCPENYVESSTGIEGSVAAVVDVAARKTCSRRRPGTLWAGCSAAWQRRRGLMRARRAPSYTICSLAGSVVRCGTRVILRTIPCKSPSVSRHCPRAGTVVHPRNPSWVATDKDNSLSPPLRAPQSACDDHDTQRRAVKTTGWWSGAGFGTRAVALTSLHRILWPGHAARAARRQRAVFLS